VSYGSGPYLLAEVGSGAVTYHMAPDLASRQRWAPTLPRVLWLWTYPPGRGELRRCHVSYDSGPCLPVEVGSDAAMCHIISDLASRQRWTPILPRVLWLRTYPPGRGGHRRCHMSYDSGPLLSTEVGSDAAKCPMAPDLTSR
jgi:hypothetical protein